MSTPFKQYIVRNAVSIAALNAAMNAAYAAYVWRGQELLALYDTRAVALDLSNTPVMIALLSTLMGTAAARKKLTDGRVDIAVAQAPQPLRSLLDLLPHGIVMRALLLALSAAALLAAPIWLALCLSGTTALPLTQAVGLKVLITVVMTLAIVPLVDLAALRDVRPGRAARLAT